MSTGDKGIMTFSDDLFVYDVKSEKTVKKNKINKKEIDWCYLSIRSALGP